MANSASKSAPPAIVKRTVAMPVRPKNVDVRTREYLTDDEVQRLIQPKAISAMLMPDVTLEAACVDLSGS